MRHRSGLGLLERLEHRGRQPGMLLRQRPAHADQMHDRENLGALVVVLRSRHRIAEQPADVLRRNRGRPRRDKAVDITLGEQFRDRLALRRTVHPHTLGQLDGDLLRPAGMLDAAADPVHVLWLDAEVVLQDGARPDVSGELVLRHADLLALQILRLLDAVGAHIDRGVAEHPRHKRRHANVRTVFRRGLHREARQRALADVEVLVAERAEEDFLRIELHENRIDAVDLHRAVDQRAIAVIVADCDGQVELGQVISSRTLTIDSPARRPVSNGQRAAMRRRWRPYRCWRHR